MPKKRKAKETKLANRSAKVGTRKTDKDRLKRVLSSQARWPKLGASTWRPLVREFAKLEEDPRPGDYWYGLAKDLCSNERKRRERLDAKRKEWR